MPNGRPGDHPLSDVLIHQHRVFGDEIDDLIHEIAQLATWKAFEGLDDLMFDVQTTGVGREKLKRQLEKRRMKLEGRWSIG
jgi:hypothetical protein